MNPQHRKGRKIHTPIVKIRRIEEGVARRNPGRGLAALLRLSDQTRGRGEAGCRLTV